MRRTILTICLGVIAWGCGDDTRGLANRVEAASDTVVAFAPDRRTLVIDGFGGTVDLVAAEIDTARLTITRRSYGSSQAVATNLLATVALSQAHDDEIVQLFLRSDHPDRTVFAIRGTVPRETPLHIRLDSGAVAVEGFDTLLRLHTDVGSVEVRPRGGSVVVEGAER